MEIIITALTDIGEAALRNEQNKKIKETMRDKIALKLSKAKVLILSEKPYTLLITLDDRLSSIPQFLINFKKKFEDALYSFNASENGKDFKIEV